jgi:ribosome-binding protein aMBF1 (putative translation factor)
MSEEKSRLRREVENIPEHKKKLHRSLTRVSMNVSWALRKSDMTKEELAEEIERPVEWMNRLLGGGIDPSLRSLYKLEEALEVKLIDVHEHKGDTDTKRNRRRRKE